MKYDNPKNDKTCKHYLNATGVGRYCTVQSCIYDPKYQRNLGPSFGKSCTVDGDLEKISADIKRKQRLETAVEQQ